MEELKIAIAHLSAAKNIAASFLAIRDFNKYAPQINDLLSKLINANETIMSIRQREASLSAKINELEKEVIRLKDWKDKKEEYERIQIASGFFAQIATNYKGDFESVHKLCDNCFNKNIEAPLQQTIGQIKKRKLLCPNGCPSVEFQFYLNNPNK